MEPMDTTDIDTFWILAFRHLRPPATKEFVVATGSLPKNSIHNDKTALLCHICKDRWLHNPPVDLIADYLRQTNSYQTVKALGRPTQFVVINFYEKGADPEAPSADHYACRKIAFMNETTFQECVAAAKAEAKADPSMNVRALHAVR
jgi:hypothetical protein